MAEQCDAGKRFPNWRNVRNHAIGLAVVYVAFFSVVHNHFRVWQPGLIVSTSTNSAVSEAASWLHGRADIPKRLVDTALVDGRFYNIFPPMMTFVSLGCLSLGANGVPVNVLSLLFVLPIPGLTYILFCRRCPTTAGAVVMTVASVLGTSGFVVMAQIMRSGAIWPQHHAIAQVGLLIFLADFFGRRRLWVGGIGLLVMAWARYQMAAFAIPYLWVAWNRSSKGRSRAGAVALTLVLLAVPALVNTVRFGNPLETAYEKIYEGRADDPDDWLARDGSEALFSVRYLARNLYWMNLGMPKISTDGAQWRWECSVYSTGIWWTTPILAYLILDRRRIFKERANQTLAAAVGVIFIVQMAYHNMGYSQPGYNRFSLDFMLVLLAFVAPFAMEEKRKYATITLVAWSVFYFRWIVP